MVSDIVYKIDKGLVVIGCVQVLDTLHSQGIGDLFIVQSWLPGY